MNGLRHDYAVILADPPWQFQSWSDKGKNRCPDAMVRQKGLSERHYGTMTIEDLQALPVDRVARNDCALFLWAIDCMLPEAIDLGRRWGFTFKTIAFTWIKRTQGGDFHVGLGHWTRGNPETCLLFTRGSPRRRSAGVRQLIDAGRREHSRKPEDQYLRIERLLDGPYLELFARQQRPGWDAWGNQVDRFNGGV